jgi:hypothetical protein
MHDGKGRIFEREESDSNKKLSYHVTPIHLPCKILLLIFSYEDTLEYVDNYSKVDTFWRECAHKFDFEYFDMPILKEMGLGYKYNVGDFVGTVNTFLYSENGAYFLSTFKGCKGLQIPNLTYNEYETLHVGLSRNPLLDRRSIKWIDFGYVNIKLTLPFFEEFCNGFPSLESLKIPVVCPTVTRSIRDLYGFWKEVQNQGYILPSSTGVYFPDLDFFLKHPCCKVLEVRHSEGLYEFLTEKKMDILHIESIIIWVPVDNPLMPSNKCVFGLEAMQSLSEFKYITLKDIVCDVLLMQEIPEENQEFVFRDLKCEVLTMETDLLESGKFDWDSLKNLKQVIVIFDRVRLDKGISNVDMHLRVPRRVPLTYSDVSPYNCEEILNFDLIKWQETWKTELELHKHHLDSVENGLHDKLGKLGVNDVLNMCQYPLFLVFEDQSEKFLKYT